MLRLPFFHLEDILVTGFGGQACRASAAGLNWVQHPGFKPNPQYLMDGLGRDTVLVHYVSARAKNLVLKALLYDGLQRRHNAVLRRHGLPQSGYNFVSNDYFGESDDHRGSRARTAAEDARRRMEKEDGNS